MVSEAIVLANPDVNYAIYDNDNDGNVDGVYVIFAGYGEEAGGPADAIWSHASNISPTVTLDGKVISRYSCSPELRGASGTNITRIGVICHEFGHVLGAPDYYDTNYETGGQFDGTGSWDMMADGSWNNGGATPAHHNAYSKVYTYNWATATTISSPADITLGNVEENSTSFYRINTPTTNEFFLIENRYKHKFDASLPGSGMIIYRVHSTYSSYVSNNKINTTHPQRMYPVSANATMEPTSTPSSYGSINSSTCAWPTASKTAFTDTSIPSSKSWLGANTAKPITGITRNATDKTVSFFFMGGAPAWPTNFATNPVSNSQINLSWTKTENKDVLLAVSTTGVFGEPGSINYTVSSNIDGGGTVIYAGGLEVFNHTGLKANTKYYYKIWSKLNTTPTWSTGTEVNAVTHPCTLIEAFPYEEYFNGATIPTCWSVIPTVATHTWQLTTGYTASTIPVNPINGTHFFYCPWNLSQDQNEMLTLPSYNLTLLENPYLKFWFNGSYTVAVTNNKCDLKVLVKVNGDSWTTIWEEANHPEFNSSAANYQWLQAKIDMSAYKEQSNVQLAFQYTGKTGSNFAIDDVQVYNYDPSSISTSFKDNVVTAFPNPFKDELKVVSDFEIEKATVFNLTGQVVASFSAVNSKEEVFNLSNLHPGSYFIAITGKNGQKVNRMVVKQ
jgi:M6 family metalloprotease-like protein